MLYDEWFDVNAIRDKRRNYDPKAQDVWLDKPQTLQVNDIEGRKSRDFYGKRIRDSEVANASSYWACGFCGLRLSKTVQTRYQTKGRNEVGTQ